MEPAQRTRMRKSSRKLEAVLGTTPLVLEAGNASESYPRAPITPRTRAYRRRGQLFEGASSCSSASSSSDSEDEDTVVDLSIGCDGDESDTSSYIMVKPTTPHGGYQPHSLPDATPDATRHARSKSEAAPKPKSKAKAPPVPSASRIHIDLPINGKHKKSGSQPILLRFSPPRDDVPFSRHNTSSSISTITSLTSPRSPFSGVFNEDIEARVKEMKRKKMAKLARTLGENVPPELVFPVPKGNERRASISRPRRNGSASSKTSLGLTKTVSSPSAPSPMVPTKFKRPHRPRSLSVPLLFPSPMVEVEQVVDVDAEPSPITFAPSPLSSVTPPTPLVVHETRDLSPYVQVTHSYTRKTASSLDSSEKVVHDNVRAASADPLRRPPIPRSNSATRLPLPYSPSKSGSNYNGRGAASLDIERPFVPARQSSLASAPVQLARTRSPVDYVYGQSNSAGHARSHTLTGAALASAAECEDLHRRKEREWSGEWNVKDMGDVVKRLRQLKGR